MTHDRPVAKFGVFVAGAGPGHARDAAAAQGMDRERGHEREARDYLAPEALVDALNTAWHTGAPLLVTGEPGTGKTQAAYWAAHALNAPVHPLFVTSRTSQQSLLYAFDRVAYFHASHRPTEEIPPLAAFRKPGPLWLAFQAEGPSVVLIDEIDKAPRDFPNDLLHILDQHELEVAAGDFDVHDCALPRWVIKQTGARPPLVVVTSNSERRLPEAFLRRCVFHHLALTPEFVDAIVAHRRTWFPGLEPEVVDAAKARFRELRALSLSKAPATAELLVWLTVLSAKGVRDAVALRTAPLGELPGIGCLVKHEADLQRLPRGQAQ